MGRPKKNPDGIPSTPVENADKDLENQEGTQESGQESDQESSVTEPEIISESDPEGTQESNTQEEQGESTAENTENATAGGDGDSGKSKPSTGKIKNPAVANRTVYGVTGKPVVFDGNGVAECDPADARQFLKVPGYEAVDP